MCTHSIHSLKHPLNQLLLSAVAKAIKVSVYFPVPVYPINTHKMNNSANPDDFLNTSIGFNFNIYIYANLVNFEVYLKVHVSLDKMVKV